MNLIQIAALDVLLAAYDPDKPVPPVGVGETVTEYWVRVVKYQAWNDGYTTGARFEHEYAEGGDPEDTTNPYERPAP